MKTFLKNIRSLRLEDRVEAYPSTLQSFSCCEDQFDVVVMYNVVNHLAEEAVVTLHKNGRMAARYVDLFKNVRAKMKIGGKIVVADFGRNNLWPFLGLRSPFCSAIEWEKHQNPSEWIRIFERAGLKNNNCRWSPYYGIGWLSTNAAFQYATRSHFASFRCCVKGTQSRRGSTILRNETYTRPLCLVAADRQRTLRTASRTLTPPWQREAA